MKVLAPWMAMTGLFLSAPLYGGGWVQQPGSSYLKVWDRAIEGDQAYSIGDDSPYEFEYFQDHQINIYYERGLTSHVTLVSHLIPVGYARTKEQKASYVGPLMVGARYGISQGGSWVSALEFHAVHEPGVGDEALIDELYEDGKRRIFYAPAVANNRGEALLQVGHGFSGGWFTASGGYKVNSSEDLDNVVLGHIQVGFQGDRIRHAYDLSLHKPMGEVEDINVAGVGQTNYVGFNIGIAYKLQGGSAVTGDLGGALMAEGNAYVPSVALGYELSR